MKVKIVSTFLMLMAGWTLVHAQSQAGISLSISKSDEHIEQVWFQQQFGSWFSAGLQVRYAGIKYRFIDAKAIKDGNAIFVGIPIGFKLAEKDQYRVDFNLTASWRQLNPDSESGFESSTAFELDPNFVFTLKASEKLFFHSGVMLRTVLQTSPEGLLEQFPSGILLNGLSVNLNSNIIALRTYFGSMSGAGGDSEKFFWQIGLGFQKTLGKKSDNSISFFNF